MTMTYNEDGTITLNKSELIAAGSLILNVEDMDYSGEKLEAFAEGITCVSILLFSMDNDVKNLVEERAAAYESSWYAKESVTS